MNTKRLFFGLMAVAFLAMATVSTAPIGDDVLEDTSFVDKKAIGRM